MRDLDFILNSKSLDEASNELSPHKLPLAYKTGLNWHSIEEELREDLSP
jgi:hypothetical protein